MPVHRGHLDRQNPADAPPSLPQEPPIFRFQLPPLCPRQQASLDTDAQVQALLPLPQQGGLRDIQEWVAAHWLQEQSLTDLQVQKLTPLLERKGPPRRLARFQPRHLCLSKEALWTLQGPLPTPVVHRAFGQTREAPRSLTLPDPESSDLTPPPSPHPDTEAPGPQCGCPFRYLAASLHQPEPGLATGAWRAPQPPEGPWSSSAPTSTRAPSPPPQPQPPPPPARRLSYATTVNIHVGGGGGGYGQPRPRSGWAILLSWQPLRICGSPQSPGGPCPFPHVSQDVGLLQKQRLQPDARDPQEFARKSRH